MKTIILSESQVKNVIERILSEQNEIRTEALTVNFDAVWAMGMWKLTSRQTGPIVEKLIQVTDFINKNKGSLVTIQIEAGESQVTNVDNEDPTKPKLQPGVLSQKRGESMVNFLNQYFQGLVGKGAIEKMPEIPAPITKIGETSYSNKPGSTDLKNKKSLYQQEQFVRAIISAKKDYECLVGMEVTIGYYPGKNSSKHFCDEAIFELRMNGVPLGEVNLNNNYLDIIKHPINYRQPDYEKYNQMYRPYYLKQGFTTIEEYINVVLQINKKFAEYGRKSDGNIGGMRQQTFILDGAKAKSIIDNAPSDKIVLSIVPLVNNDAKYKILTMNGSHADTPWVTIKSKKSADPLYNQEPNTKMQRGSSVETILLQTDLCGSPIQTKQK
jgi:hypothetical protein